MCNKISQSWIDKTRPEVIAVIQSFCEIHIGEHRTLGIVYIVKNRVHVMAWEAFKFRFIPSSCNCDFKKHNDDRT